MVSYLGSNTTGRDEPQLNGHVGRGSIVQGLAARLLGKKCLQNPQMNPSLCKRVGALLFRALQHVKEGVQPTPVSPWAPFLHLHIRYHITPMWDTPMHPDFRVSHSLCEVLTSLLSYTKASEKNPARGWFINRHVLKKGPSPHCVAHRPPWLIV